VTLLFFFPQAFTFFFPETGAMLQFGFLAAVFWWVLIALNMCLEVKINSEFSLVKQN